VLPVLEFGFLSTTKVPPFFVLWVPRVLKSLVVAYGIFYVGFGFWYIFTDK